MAPGSIGGGSRDLSCGVCGSKGQERDRGQSKGRGQKMEDCKGEGEEEEDGVYPITLG